MEVASSLTDRGVAVSVVDRSAVPLSAALGEEVGGVFQNAAEEKGVAFHLEADIERIEQADGGLEVVLRRRASASPATSSSSASACARRRTSSPATRSWRRMVGSRRTAR